MTVRADRRKARTAAVAKAQGDRATRRQAARTEAARKQEEVDEAVAPAIQRLGTDTKHPRLVRDGITFRVSCPIEQMVKQGKKRERNGGDPTINERHLVAIKRLSISWEIGQTVTAGISGYDQKISGTPDSGYLSQAQIRRVTRQRDAADEVASVRLALGSALWPIVEAIGLKGQTARAWAEERRMAEAVALGFLRASLDVLVAHLAWRDALMVPRKEKARA